MRSDDLRRDRVLAPIGMILREVADLLTHTDQVVGRVWISRNIIRRHRLDPFDPVESAELHLHDALPCVATAPIGPSHEGPKQTHRLARPIGEKVVLSERELLVIVSRVAIYARAESADYLFLLSATSRRQFGMDRHNDSRRLLRSALGKAYRCASCQED